MDLLLLLLLVRVVLGEGDNIGKLVGLVGRFYTSGESSVTFA